METSNDPIVIKYGEETVLEWNSIASVAIPPFCSSYHFLETVSQKEYKGMTNILLKRKERHP